LYEAAIVDGANAWQRFWFVTWPMITPTLLYVLLTSLIGSFQMFDVAWIMGGTQGGVGGSLRFYLINLWNQGFRDGRMGYASALAWILVLMAAVIILAIFRTSSRWVYYEYEPDKV
jgi:multiple sugar transport system permease protein